MSRLVGWFFVGVLALVLPVVVSADSALIGKRITTQTTTTLLAGVAGQHIFLLQGSICIDGNGVVTGITIQDSTPSNLVGTSVVYVLSPGACYTLFPRQAPYLSPTADGKDLQLVTTVGNGPVNVSLEVVQR